MSDRTRGAIEEAVAIIRRLKSNVHDGALDELTELGARMGDIRIEFVGRELELLKTEKELSHTRVALRAAKTRLSGAQPGATNQSDCDQLELF